MTATLPVAALVVGFASDGVSQTIVAPSSQESPADTRPAAAPAPDYSAPVASPANPGLLNEIGRLFKGSSSLIPDLKSSRETLDDLTKAAAPTLLVTGRAACPVAANGAPDCKAGADQLCRSKGYKQGKSLDTDAAQTCSAKYAMTGKPCRTENFVTRAACQ